MVLGFKVSRNEKKAKDITFIVVSAIERGDIRTLFDLAKKSSFNRAVIASKPEALRLTESQTSLASLILTCTESDRHTIEQLDKDINNIIALKAILDNGHSIDEKTYEKAKKYVWELARERNRAQQNGEKRHQLTHKVELMGLSREAGEQLDE